MFTDIDEEEAVLTEDDDAADSIPDFEKVLLPP